MTTHSVNLQEAEGHLKELAELATQGTEVIITMDNGQAVKLVVEGKKRENLFGLYEGKIQISDDFDAELPESYWLGDSQ